MIAGSSIRFAERSGFDCRRAALLVAAWLIAALMIAAPAVAQTKKNARPEGGSISPSGFELHGNFVNFVAGSGRCICTQPANENAKQPLTNGDTIELDEGRAELVLVPGYYLRLSDHTTARVLDLASENLKIEITRGSAIIEIPIENATMLPEFIQEIKARFFNNVTVITPAGEYAILKGGGYRFNVLSSRESRVKVLKGAVAVSGQILESGEAATVVANVAGRESAEQYPDDAFDKWSRDRAAALIELNKSLKHSEWYKQMMDGHGYLDFRDDEPAVDAASARVVSARKGVAGFVESGAKIKRSDGDWHELKTGVELSDGDRLRTEAHSRAEIRPYPDFELYLNGDTEITCHDDADGNISIDVVRGSVVVMVAETRVKREDRNTLKLSANNADFSITSPGYYRLSVFSPEQSEMLVYSGAIVSALGETGRGKRIVTNGQNRLVSSFDRDARDSFDVWSTRRNARLALAGLRRWSPTGLWFLNREMSEYTFLPGDREYKSPYGGSYSTIYSSNRSSGARRPRDRSLRPNP